MRPFGLNYSRFIDGLDKAGVLVDRKVLSDLAITEPAAFQAIVEKAKAALPAAAEAATPRHASVCPERLDSPAYVLSWRDGGHPLRGMTAE